MTRSVGHGRPRRYPSGATDAEWQIAPAYRPAGGPGPGHGRPPLTYPRRDIVDAIRYGGVPGCVSRFVSPKVGQPHPAPLPRTFGRHAPPRPRYQPTGNRINHAIRNALWLRVGCQARAWSVGSGARLRTEAVQRFVTLEQPRTGRPAGGTAVGGTAVGGTAWRRRHDHRGVGPACVPESE
jgi:hypothetical protein